jgi:hypothetical protein
MPEKEQSHVSALWEVGMFKPYDLVVVGLEVLIAVTTGFWWLFKPEPQVIQLLVPFMVFVIVLMLWLVSLMYRCIWFVVKTWADIKNLPASAAKLAIAFARGTSVPGTPAPTEPNEG